MIVEGLLSILFSALFGLLSLLPDISWTVQADTFTKFFEVIRVAGYLLPMNTISVIFGLIVSLILFRIVISLIKTIWQLLPLV